jgi:replicative DNA helicase
MSGAIPVKTLIDTAAAQAASGAAAPVPDAANSSTPARKPEPAIRAQGVVKASPSAANDWPELALPAASTAPDIPATVLPGWVGDMAGAVAASTQTPPALSVMAALSVLATCLQGRFEVAPWSTSYSEVLALWTLGVADSGARKSAVLGAMMAPLLGWEKRQRDRVRPEIAERESMRVVAAKRIERLKTEAARAKGNEEREAKRIEIQQELEAMPGELVAPRLFTGDCTAERLQTMLAEHAGRMAILSDEGGIFGVMAGQYTGGRAYLDCFLQAYSGSPIRVDRGGRLAHIDRPVLSFGLLLQPDTLADVAKSRNFRGSGLLARFLYAAPVSTVGKRDVRDHRDVPAEVARAWDAHICGLLDGATLPDGKPRVLGFSATALELWLEFAEHVEANQGAGCQWSDIRDWTSKLPGTVARIAGLLELAANGTGAEAVNTDGMVRAVSLGHLLIEHALAAFAQMGAGKAEGDAEALLAWIKKGKRDGFTKREAQRALESRFRTKEPLEAAIKLLQEWGVLSDGLDRHPSETGGKGGRPSAFYLVNPKLQEAA